MTRTRLYWICQLGGWAVALAGFVLLAALTGGIVTPGATVAEVVFAFALGYVMVVGGTHGIHRTAVRRGWTRLPLRALVPRLALAVLVAAALTQGAGMVVSHLAEPIVNPSAEHPLPPPRLLDTMGSTLTLASVFAVWAVVYALIATGFRLRDAERDRLQLRAALAEARMATLESQLNPHFLFNALNTVRALIPEDPSQARRAVTLLSALLRQTLTTARAAAHPLADELDVVETYLELEALRFGDRLRVRIEADDTARRAAVPALLVQTLVENAVKHGIARRRDGGEVAVTAVVYDDRLSIRVSNPTPAAASASGAEGTGTGLANARERLVLLHGDRARLTLDLDDTCAVAQVEMPATFPSDHD